MVKITTRALKIGVQSRFYPISTVGFCTFSRKFWAGLLYTYRIFEIISTGVNHGKAAVVSNQHTTTSPLPSVSKKPTPATGPNAIPLMKLQVDVRQTHINANATESKRVPPLPPEVTKGQEQVRPLVQFACVVYLVKNIDK